MNTMRLTFALLLALAGTARAEESASPLRLFQAQAQAQQLQFAPVYLGGITNDMTNLATASTTTNFRAQGGALYAHANWVLANTSGTCPAQTASTNLANTETNFANQAAPMAEWGVLTALGAAQLMECNYHTAGLYPKVILSNINFNTANGAITPYSQWKAMVDSGRLHGAVLFAPVCSANYQGDTINWTASEWTLCKQFAVYGGALAMDTPPTEDIAQGTAYDTFAQQQLAWCKANNVACIDILSPYAGGEPNFTPDMLSWLGKIEAYGNKPAAFVVENYNVDSSTNVETIGTELTSPSLSSAALLLARIVNASGDPAIPYNVLPSTCTPGSRFYVTNGRKPGEAAGAGSGVPVVCTLSASGGSDVWWSAFSAAAVTD